MTDWLSPTVEYGTDDRWAFGTDLSCRYLYGRVVYLDETNGWYAAVGHVFEW